MSSSEEFRRRATECGHMAKLVRDKKSGAEWNSMAERYLRFAEWYDAQRCTADQSKRSRKIREPS
jgi:hypothetical protein